MDTRTVLVVDDIALMRAMLARYISMAAAGDGEGPLRRYEVVEAGNGLEALDVLAQRPVDLIFLDLMMPKMDGLTFLEAVRGGRVPNRVPVVVTSALSEERGVAHALELGADAYIVKPCTLADVRALLEALLGEEGRSG